MTDVRSAEWMTKTILSDPGKLEQLKTNPGTVLTETAAEAVRQTGRNDVWVYRLVVIFLGSTTLFVVIGMIAIVLMPAESRPIPDGLIALGSAAVGALAGLLAPTPSGN